MLSASGIDIQFSVSMASFWASQPSSVDPMFVVGSSHGLYIAYAGESSWDLQRMKGRRDEDFLAVDWLDRNAVIGGSRTGNVVFVDQRAGHDAMTRLIGGSAVSGVKNLGDHLVAVRTLERMDIFDLRFTPEPNYANQESMSGRLRKARATRPYRTSTGGRPSLRPSGCFDHEDTVGLLATGALPSYCTLTLISKRSMKLTDLVASFRGASTNHAVFDSDSYSNAVSILPHTRHCTLLDHRYSLRLHAR